MIAKAYLFATNDGGIVDRGSYILYSARFKLNGVLTRDLVPCYLKADSSKHTAGLYDLVSNTFFDNIGTGYFEVGEDVN